MFVGRRWGVHVGVRDVREDVTVDNSTGTRIRCIVMGDAYVGFNFSDVGGKS